MYNKIEQIRNQVKGYWSDRIFAEIQCVVKVSENKDGKYHDLIEQSVNLLVACYDEDQTITRTAALESEKILLPAAEDVKSYTIHCIAHAHIDMNWMWDFSETTSITLDTFRTMLDLMKEYPTFTFSQSQASTYQIVQEHDPKLLEEIQQRVREGRWEISASTWVEGDKNMPNGESLARHVLYTKRYINQLFGVAMDDLSLDFEPDTFGHSWNIPEILNKGGVKYYYHHRAYDGHFVYRWRSQSGAEVLVYKDPMGYGVTVSVDHLAYLIQFCNDMSINDAIYNYGVGDHGGGPTRRDIELIQDMTNWPLAPTVIFSKYSDFYSKLEKVRETLPIVNQELNFVFTGCYTSQSRIKLSNRISEDRLYEAESIATSAMIFAEAENDTKSFEKAWIKTLFNQFHDILPGSGIVDTREYCLGEFQKTMAITNTNAKNAMNHIAAQIDTSDIPFDPDHLTTSEGAGVGYGLEYGSNYHFAQTERGRGKTRILHLFNPTEFDREGPVQVTLWDWNYNTSRMVVTDAEGQGTAFEVLPVGGDNTYWRHTRLDLLIAAKVKAFGYATYIVTEQAATISRHYEYLTNTALNHIDFDKVLENDQIKAVFKAGDMRLVSLIDKKSGRDMVCKDQPGCAFRYIYEDVVVKMYNSAMSAWCVGKYTKITDLNQDGKVTVYEECFGKLRQTLKYKIEFERSSLNVVISLDKNSSMIVFDVTADWHEIGNKEYVPQLNFVVPFGFNASKYRYDIPFGTIDREPIHDDTPGNSFILAMPDENSGKPLILVTDSKYGFRGVNNSLAVDLIRSTTEPDPYPEDGIHKIRLGVGIIDSLCNMDVYKSSSSFVHPVSFVSGTVHSGSLPKTAGMIKLEGEVKCSAIKMSEDGNGMILRLYDANGKGSDVTVTLPKIAKAAMLTDLTEIKNLGEVIIDQNMLRFRIGAYEMVTVKVLF